MQVDLQQTDQKDIADWEKWVADKTDFKIRIKTYRSDQTDAGLDNTGAKAIWTKGSALEPAPDANPNLENAVTKNQLLAYLKGGATSKVLFHDDLTNYAIPEGGKVSFKYNADVSIIAKDKSGNIMEKKCGRSDSIEMTWFRPMKEKENIGTYFSVPKYFSEIKEGSPQLSGTGSNETFDAMSGTPTTRSLYFASGGSEFIVDIETEYVPKVTQTRTYTSEYNAVVNGWAMSPITGGVGHDSVPSRPSARTKVDASGASYTEVVSQKSSKHVTKAAVPCSGTPCTGGSPEESHTDYWWVQEGYDSHTVGGYVDTWTQTVTFDYMRINKAVVWKLDRSKVNGMATLVGTNEVTATVTQGDPNVFYNFAQSNTSAAGRLRYSLETNQHDHVYWNEGNSDNSLSNSKIGPVNEQQKFDERRAMTTNVTAISDFLILQTSQGDQSVMYFQKASNTAKVTEQLDVPTTDFDTMWTNNPQSAAKWDPKDTIRVGSYNGNFGSPTYKYSGGSTGTVSTIFDSMPAGLNRPARPAPFMRVMTTGLDVPNALPNGEYVTGSSSVFYRLMFSPYNPLSRPVTYNTGSNSKYGLQGQEFASAYSSIHQKVNDVVIHNPVSVEDALVISLPSALDQRTPASRALGGNKQEGIAEYERVLDPDYRQNIIPNPDAEIVNADGTVAGWNTWVSSGSASNLTFTHRSGDTWVIGPGAKTFEVRSAASSGTTGGYWQDIPVKPNTQYRFEGDISCHRCVGYFLLDFYSAGWSSHLGSVGSGDPSNNAGIQHKTITFTTPANTSYVRIHLKKGNNVSTSNAYDYLFVDNLSLKNMSVQEFVAVAPVSVTQEVPNPDYIPSSTGASLSFDYTGSEQTFTATTNGTYTIEAWGARGGIGGDSTVPNRGGYAKGSISLNAGDTLKLYVGGKGGDRTGGIDGCDCYNSNGGFNGGGSGVGTAGPGGGGASDVRDSTGGTSSRMLVAGGGSGARSASYPSWGGTDQSTSTLFQGQNGDTGRHSSSYPNDEGGGGGGYYGGMVIHGDDPGASYGGTSYVSGTLSGAQTIPGNQSMPAPAGGTQTGQDGDGAIRITVPPQAAVGSPTRIITTLAGGSDTSPPSEAYILIPKQTNPATPAGGYSPGNFVLLDHGFQLYYPNTGDFYGNGQWGWAQTTSLRGKGFIDNMDTTEWTKEKYVKFDFNVIYNNVLYLANEWIPLNVAQTAFDFYVPLANREKVSAMVEWKSIAINAVSEDSDMPTNRVRYGNYAANHSTLKKYQVDVVGRIGNMIIEDTGDFRFSNLFKQPLTPTEWLVPNVVRRVNPNVQNKIMGDFFTIRGDAVTAGTNYLNTWGMLGHLEQDPIRFPLVPSKNNIPALQNQPLRLGYEVLTDIQTMGNYYGNLQVIPYYYHLNLKNGSITPVDLYMKSDGGYKLINKNGGVFPGWNPASVYANSVSLNWGEQARRRNVTSDESGQTSRIAALFAESGGDSATGKAAEPFGSYPYGTSQLLQLTGRNRTYIGRDETYGTDRNPGNKLSMLEYAMQAQRWHYSYVMPSSTVAVRSGQPATKANIDALRTNTGVIVLAADIKAVGDTYTLQYDNGGNGTVSIAGTSWSLAGIPHPVVAVYSASKSSADDLDISGTH
ncbi:glycine rich domain-containing protein [Cohnella sp. GCM10027633]|uniref:glycine rich domain-containing protein n=1 Tax=unclassified Cohnella TaxID=2636738 RepID=UPI003627C235